MTDKQSGSNRGQLIDKVITEAAATGNMKAAIEKHGHGLTQDDTKVLTSLSHQEIQSAVALRQKLAPLAHVAADNNGGVF